MAVKLHAAGCLALLLTAVAQAQNTENVWPTGWDQPCTAAQFIATLKNVSEWSTSAAVWQELLTAGVPVPQRSTLFLPQDRAWTDFKTGNGNPATNDSRVLATFLYMSIPKGPYSRTKLTQMSPLQSTLGTGLQTDLPLTISAPDPHQPNNNTISGVNPYVWGALLPVHRACSDYIYVTNAVLFPATTFSAVTTNVTSAIAGLKGSLNKTSAPPVAPTSAPTTISATQRTASPSAVPKPAAPVPTAALLKSTPSPAPSVPTSAPGTTVPTTTPTAAPTKKATTPAPSSSTAAPIASGARSGASLPPKHLAGNATSAATPVPTAVTKQPMQGSTAAPSKSAAPSSRPNPTTAPSGAPSGPSSSPTAAPSATPTAVTSAAPTSSHAAPPAKKAAPAAASSKKTPDALAPPFYPKIPAVTLDPHHPSSREPAPRSGLPANLTRADTAASTATAAEAPAPAPTSHQGAVAVRSVTTVLLAAAVVGAACLIS